MRNPPATRASRDQAPAPYLAHRDEQKHGSHQHGQRHRNAIGGGQIVRFAKAERQAERHDHQQPIDDADVDLAIAFGRGLLDRETRHPAQLDRLPRHRKGAGDDRLAGDDGGDGRQHDQRHQQRRRAQTIKNVAVGRRAFQHQRGLPGIIQDQARQDDEVPGEADRNRAEMAHVGVKRLGAGDAKKDAAEHQKARQPARRTEYWRP